MVTTRGMEMTLLNTAVLIVLVIQCNSLLYFECAGTTTERITKETQERDRNTQITTNESTQKRIVMIIVLLIIIHLFCVLNV
jgi:hypothetical protein